MPGPHKVGIVVVSYNAATAVRVTLASVRAARNDAASELVLVDNASRADDREEIRRAMERHVQEARLPWRHLQSDKNLGFSGGNNVGMRALLADPTITHVCLLNSDVIVPHHWLDQLLASGKDIVSPVTNKAMSEQCVPVDYRFELADCLDPTREQLRDDVFTTIDAFAARRHHVFGGHRVDCDATFFCVLLSRAAVDGIGLLDETFFPGGFEDDDYCARARAHGMPVWLDRGVFVHHWGSASFGQLDPGYFNDNAARNRARLEQKHGITWRTRPEKPLVAFAQDMAFALREPRDVPQALAFCNLYGDELHRLLAHYRREFTNLRQATTHAHPAPPPELVAATTAAAAKHGDLETRWRRAFGEVRSRLRGSSTPARTHQELLEQLHQLAETVHEVVDHTFAMHRFLTAQAPNGSLPSAVVRQSRWHRLWSLLRHGVPFVLRLRGIIFFGGYSYAPRDNDGYFQRIRAIDRLFEDRWRIYFDPSPLPGQTHWYDIPAPRTLVLRPGAGRWQNRVVVALVWLLAMRCRAIWFHSVLRMEDMGFARLLRLPFVRKVLDVHGVVPEEFRMHDDFASAVLFDRHEQLAVRKVHGLIVVTEAMRRYFAQKYRASGRGEVLVLPIFPAIACYRDHKPLVDGRPVVVYAGGLHKWQQVPKMIDAMLRTRQSCWHRFYCTDPDAVLRLLPEEAIDDGSIVVDRKTHDELLECYRECHYGFLLRVDSVVNRVACPTKVVEYLAMGIVPILDCEQVGDFTELGMRFVRLEDFVAGRLPDAATREAMARENFAIQSRLQEQREAGGRAIRRLLGPGIAVGSLISRCLWQIGKLLPPSSLRGRLARKIWHGLQPAKRAAPAATRSPLAVDACDVLVQVGNFTAGGLENVVLDLNEALQAAGLRVCLLVLGAQGPAVARARAQGVSVHTMPFDCDVYRELLRKAAPKAVISHYSIDGASSCRELGIPLVQVIHNIYLWLSAAEREAMQASVAHTDLFVAVSSYVKDYSVRRLGVPRDKCVVIANGVDVARFRDQALGADRLRLRASLGIGPDDFVFLNVGAVNHQKNHLSQLRAFHAMAPSCPRARLVVVGPIYEQEVYHACRNYLERNDLSDRVVFTGGVSDPHRYFGMADAMTHSAFFEGGQLSLLEGIATNLPVITVEVGFATHFVGVPGITVVPAHFDVTTFAGHITEMQSSPATEQALTRAMLDVCRDRVRPNFSATMIDSLDRTNTYKAYVELVQELIRNRANDRGDQRITMMKSWPEQLDASA